MSLPVCSPRLNGAELTLLSPREFPQATVRKRFMEGPEKGSLRQMNGFPAGSDVSILAAHQSSTS